MRFQGKFINEKGEEVTRWFEFPTVEEFKEHLAQRGWKAVECEEIKSGSFLSTHSSNLNKRQVAILWVGITLCFVLMLVWLFSPSLGMFSLLIFVASFTGLGMYLCGVNSKK